MREPETKLANIGFRDLLIAEAMSGLLAHSGGSASETALATRAVAFADAVLAELAKPSEGLKAP